MGELIIHYRVARDSLNTLGKILKEIDNEQYFSFEQARDVAIHRFEYSLEMFWKYLKGYLIEEKMIDASKIMSPRSVFKACVEAKLILPQDLKTCISMVENRNRTSHAYHLEMAEKIFELIPDHYMFMKTILDRLSDQASNL